MGKLAYETYDPDELGLPNDTDFELEGIDEDYESYQEYEVYLPDRVAELHPLSQAALDACAAAEHALADLRSQQLPGAAASVTADLLLIDEAVSTAQIEGYRATCDSALEYLASEGPRRQWREAEAAATDAICALRSFVCGQRGRVSLEDLCAANALFTKSGSTAEMCGSLRERPVFIGGSLFDAEFVPPPADTLEDYLADLERYLNADLAGASVVAKAAIAYVQFVTIHPFEDGNGRTGRAISQWVLQEAGSIDVLLPTSSVSLQDLSGYLDAINRSHNTRGPADMSEFVVLFAASVERAAEVTRQLGERVERVLTSWDELVGEGDAAVREALDAFATMPVTSEAALSARLGTDVAPALATLVDCGILTGRRSRYASTDLYVAKDLLVALTAAQQLNL